MVKINKLKNGEISLGTNKMGTVNFPLPPNIKSKKGFTAFEVLQFVVDKANKNYCVVWKACPWDVAQGNKKKINEELKEVVNNKELASLYKDIKDTIENKMTKGIITTTKLKKLSSNRYRKFLDRTNEATRLELDYLVCSGFVRKIKQADVDADEKKSANWYEYYPRGECPYLKKDYVGGYYQCTCKKFFVKEKGVKLI